MVPFHVRLTSPGTTTSRAALAKKDIVSATRISRLDEINVLEQPLKAKLDTVTFQRWETKFLKRSLR